MSETGAAHVGLIYPIIPRIQNFQQPLKSIVQQAFLDSLRPVWITVTVLSVAGFLSSLMMENVPMHVYTDEKWNPGVVSQKSEKEADQGTRDSPRRKRWRWQKPGGSNVVHSISQYPAASHYAREPVLD